MTNWKPQTRIRCDTCGDVVQSRYSGDWCACSCFTNEKNGTGVYVDETRWHVHVGGRGPYTILTETGGD